MSLALAAVLGGVLLAATPSDAIVAGSIRDQYGDPIAGARVTVLLHGHPMVTTRTQSDGTFLADAAGTRVLISCRYCQGLEVPIGSDGTVVAIVVRYEAIRNPGPGAHDLERLPAATVPEVLQLVPFAVVNETSRSIPGVSVSDRNATPYGGLIVIDGAPAYDVTAGVTALGSLPQGGVSNLVALPAQDAYRYGDVAQGGTFAFDSTGAPPHGAVGTNVLARFATNSSNAATAMSYASANGILHAARTAVALHEETAGTSSDLQLSSGEGISTERSTNALSSSFSSASATFRTKGTIDSFARLVTDRGTYGYASGLFPSTAAWSDVDASFGVDSHAVLAPFLHVDLRDSHGDYASKSARFAGAISQWRTTAGLSYDSTPIEALVAVGDEQFTYGGVPASGQHIAGSTSDGVASFTYRLAKAWTMHASTSSGYTLNTLEGVYTAGEAGYATNVAIAGNTNEALIEWSDDARVRASVTALSWKNAAAATSSAGASVAWQIAPSISLRTWILRSNSTIWNPATVGSAWLTYTNSRAFRADLMFGRSLLDHAPYGHIDATFSGRLGERFDWFLSSVRVAGAQETSVGIMAR